MESKVRDLRQQLFNFKFNKSFNQNDFFVSECNFYVYNLFLSWPKWEKKIINIHGERYSGKTHLINIFLEKNKGLTIDLNRLKNCLFAEIQKPDDILIKALITKNLADYQITLDSKLVDFISKRITRSYIKIREFICTIDEISLKKKKPINMKIIKDILEDKIEKI